MKYIYQIAVLFFTIAMASCSTSKYYQSNPDEYYQDDQNTITYQQFYNDLSPYGDWTNYGNYGYVWIPNLPNFRPYYTNGQWVYTDYGWTWASNYNWGWAPFHYGRWIQDRSYGWMWIPGTEWAPAWVSWRGGGDYYGWAPLGPEMNAGYYGSIPYNNWTFVPRRYITSPRIHNYYINQSRNVTIINNTRIINNTNVTNKHRSANTPYYNPGPPVREVEKSTGTQIRRYNVVQSNKPEAPQINNNSIRVFRPTIKQPENSRPERVTDLNQARTTNNQTAPVREIPKDQTPQINRNEPPVNNSRPSIIPDKNIAPSRVFPNTNTQTPAQRNPDVVPQNESNRNPQPATNSTEQNQKLNAPVRTLPNKNNLPPAQSNPDPVIQNQSNRQSAPETENKSNTPVRTFPNRQQLNANPVQQRPVNRQPAPVKSTPRSETRSISNQPVNRTVVREKQEIREVRPSQNVRELRSPKKEDK
jgi:hypothetical protein